jgi:hypothetical protein
LPWRTTCAERAGDADVAGFERLAQRLQHAPLEFGQLVEEQHAVVGQRDIAWARIRTAETSTNGPDYNAGLAMLWVMLRV